jgi:hypothetical protein
LHIDKYAEQALSFVLKGCKGEQRRAWNRVYQQIKVAVPASDPVTTEPHTRLQNPKSRLELALALVGDIGYPRVVE